MSELEKLLREESGLYEDVSSCVLDAIEEGFREEQKEIEYSDEDFIPESSFSGIESDFGVTQREMSALFWLAKEIKVRHPDSLIKTLELLRSNSSAYKVIYLPKSDGGKRQVCIPNETLKAIQRKINKYILSCLNSAQNVFGFSGGSIGDAINPHLGAKSILCVDFEDAFPTITFDNIFDYFTTGRNVWRNGPWWHREIARIEYKIEYGWFSWYAARMLAELTTYKKELPQGAPTSPRLFDLMCEDLDKKLLKLAKNLGGNYTRYADNIFFSVDQEEFPRPLKQAILKLIEGRRRTGPNFEWHKLRIRKLDREPQRMLGLNIIESKVHNTRAFKRRLRLSIHHVNWLVVHGMDYGEAWQKLQGQMAFARIDTLPKGILDSYLALERRIM